MNNLATIHVLETSGGFVLRQIDRDGPSVTVVKNDRVRKPDAKRIAIPFLDRDFGRHGWRFA